MAFPSIPRSTVKGAEPTISAETTPVEIKPSTKTPAAIVDSQVEPGQGAPVKVLSKEEPPSLADVAKMRGQQQRAQKNREQLSNLATAAATQAATEHGPGAVVTGSHPLLEKFGESIGLTLGVIVTEALALLPSWNKPLVDAAGKPVEHIEGADRIGDHDLRKRHEEVVGPKVEAFVKTLHPGVIHDLLEGFAKGATEAPGASYRLEAKISDIF